MEEWLYSALRLLLTILIVVSIYTKVINTCKGSVGLSVCLSVRTVCPVYCTITVPKVCMYHRYGGTEHSATMRVRITGKYEYLFFLKLVEKTK